MAGALQLPELAALRALSADGRLLLATRLVRLFAFGFLAVVLALYLAALGLREAEIGLLLTLTLAGDAALCLLIASLADRLGRRRMLLLSGGLMLLAGLALALSAHLALVIAVAVVGTLSPSGGEAGPAAALEQAALPQTAPDTARTAAFAWYNLAGSLAAALGSLAGGALAAALPADGALPLLRYRVILAIYGLLGLLLMLLAARLSPAVEAPLAAQEPQLPRAWLGLRRSRAVVLRLSALFAVDAFAGGLIVQSLLAYWLSVRFGVTPALLGAIFFGANLFAALSALAAARLAARIGLINTMVWTHIPSNVLLMLVPLMPTLPLAIGVLLLRASISQMDVPTRQSYLAAVVEPAERAAAAGVTMTARTLGTLLAPALSGLLLSVGWLSAPFFLGGALKIGYDLALFASFRALRPPEEQRGGLTTGETAR
jgi:MFS family permease